MAAEWRYKRKIENNRCMAVAWGNIKVCVAENIELDD